MKNVFIDFRIHWNTLMKILYLKGYKWLLSQNQRVRIDFLGNRPYEALIKHIKSFLKKQSKTMSVPRLHDILGLDLKNTQTTFLDFDRFCDTLDLDFKILGLPF